MKNTITKNITIREVIYSRINFVENNKIFDKRAKKGSPQSGVREGIEGVIRYKKNGNYIDIVSDGSIVSLGKQ